MHILILYLTNDSSQVSISSKITQLSGTYQWKVTAVDKTGHTQDSDTRNIKVNNVNQSTNSTPTGYFPLAILNISGVGNPFISTTNPSIIKDTYNLNSLNPIFFGIASVNAKVTLTLTDQSCPSASSGSSMTTDCIKTYSTTSNPESRFGINVPIGDLTWNKKYTADLSVAYNQDYNELPQFTLSTAGYSTTSTSTQKTSSTDSIQQSASPTIAPTPQPIPIPQPIGGQQLIPKKKCFLFFCY